MAKCPKCGEQVNNTMDKCPSCGVKLSWQSAKKKTRKDETSDFLLNTHYLWKTVNYICPWISVALLFTFKSYANNINGNKVKAYDDLKKHTLVLGTIHLVCIIVLIVYGLALVRNAQNGAQ